ncbi:MAG: hypothetical protein QM802_06160 [Agriterribacter sp.]
MKKILVAIFCTFSILSYSQSKKFQFKTGSEYGLPRKAEDLSFFGNDEDGIVNLSLKREALYFTRFDPKTLTQTDERIINLPEATGNMNSEMVVDFNKNYYWLMSDWDKDAQLESLYAVKVDVKNGKLSEKNQKLIETTKMASNGLAGRGFYRFKQVEKYQFNYDADHKKLLVSYRLTPEDKRDKYNYDKLGMYVFDENMQKLWGGEFTMPYTEKRMDNEDFAVDAKGDAYLLAKVYETESRKEKDKDGNAGYHLEVFKFTKNNKQVINATVSIDQYFIQESSLIENAMHDMIIACTYSKKAWKNGTEGIFLGILNTEGKVADYKKGFYKFPAAELEKFESRRQRRRIEKNEEYEIPNLKVRDVVVEKDGSVFIACEEYYYVEHYSNSGFGATGIIYTTSGYTTYYYGDMLGTKIDASGNFLWMRKMPKRQSGTKGRGTMSFKLISDETGYYFLYLDNKKNEHLEEDETPAKHTDGFGGQVMVSKIDNKGDVTKEVIFDTREEDVMIFPSEFTKINDHQFIGRARIKRTLFKPVLITMQ